MDVRGHKPSFVLVVWGSTATRMGSSQRLSERPFALMASKIFFWNACTRSFWVPPSQAAIAALSGPLSSATRSAVDFIVEPCPLTTFAGARGRRRA